MATGVNAQLHVEPIVSRWGIVAAKTPHQNTMELIVKAMLLIMCIVILLTVQVITNIIISETQFLQYNYNQNFIVQLSAIDNVIFFASKYFIKFWIKKFHIEPTKKKYLSRLNTVHIQFLVISLDLKPAW